MTDQATDHPTGAAESRDPLADLRPVEVTLTGDGGATHLELVHRDLPSGTVDEHRHGWQHFLGQLASKAQEGSLVL